MNLYEFLEKINALKRTPRMGWLESGIKAAEAEDVAQHTFETSTITLLLVDSSDEEIDRGCALKMSIIHDWAEAITGDFPREMSVQMGREVKERIEEKAMEDLLTRDIPKREEYLEIWREYSEMETKESKLVHAADRLSILIEASELFRRGERSKRLDEIWKTVREELEAHVEDFPVLRGLLQSLDENYSSAR